MSFVPAILFYDVVVFVHVAAIVAAFGVTFVYPVVFPWLQRAHPQVLATAHEAQSLIGKRIIGPSAILALASGIYLAADRDLFSESWVTVPLTALILLIAGGPLFFVPRERRAAELARRDAAAGGTLSAEYAANARVLALGGVVSTLLVLTALFFMIVKP